MISVTIREKDLKDGRKSLYLDIYDNGKRKRESLDMHLYPEKNASIKAYNREIRKRAEVAKGKILAEAQDAMFSIRPKSRPLFLETYEEFMTERPNPTYRLLYNHFCKICKAGMKVDQIDGDWMQFFVTYLRRRGVMDNSIADYLAKMKVFWKWCTKRSFVSGNPFEDIKLKLTQTKREYLTIEELQQLINTPTKYRVRNMFLFSCMTGLRYSDTTRLRWGDVEETNGRTRLIFRQKKTRAQEYMDINKQAESLMGERGADDNLIFGVWDERNTYEANYQLKRWVKSAGIKKNISFHCARHTFATMLLTLDANIYVVSKLLGHSNINTTQVYAKIVDTKKQEAVDSIPQLL